jgi:DNA polymerase-3 subunit alpha
LVDFCARIESSYLNRRTLEALIKAGAFDWVNLSRAEMIARLDDVVECAAQSQKERSSNQLSLFAPKTSGDLENIALKRELLPEWPINIKLTHEKEALGFYLSGHPLEKFRDDLKRLGTTTIETIRSAKDGAGVTVAGVITLLRLKNTKKGDRYATFILEDLKDTIEVIVWPDTYQKIYAVLTSEDPVVIAGKLDVSDERQMIIASNVQSAITLRDSTAREAVVQLHHTRVTDDVLGKLKKVLQEHHGSCPVRLIIHRPGHSETVVTLPPEMSVAPSEGLCNRVEELFGEPVLSFR